MKLLLILCLAVVNAALFTNKAVAQEYFTETTTLYLMHSSGHHLKDGNIHAQLEAMTANQPQRMCIIPDGDGFYTIQSETTGRYLNHDGEWDAVFLSEGQTNASKFAIETVDGFYVILRCKANNKCLGTDYNEAEAYAFTDKAGNSPLHYWYFSENVRETPPVDTLSYIIAPSIVRQRFDGWGVSLCWWANMCGKWDDSKINKLVNWLVSPTGLNYSHFRYNIGGGDDPDNAHCDLHHMGKGKGLRAEMEGFKDHSNDTYHWDRDEAQRKIMLKIKEKRPDAVFEAFSNSAPYYMTYSGCVAGNNDGWDDNLRPEYYEEFAHYLVDVCTHYRDEYGIEFKTLEPFNEPVTGFWYANGSQEGCQFSTSAQIDFLRVLHPILKASGLKTVISASDETKVAQSVADFKEYQSKGALSLVAQWNTHTYSATNADRAKQAQLAHQAGIPLWMSEVGAGGSGIGGNLNLAQKLFDDMRYLQPETWIDWQVMEEGNDQWCTVTGSFSDQTFAKNKNYYVRQQCSRFIKRGYDIITSLCNQSLAAMNPARDTLVLVLLNEGTQTVHNINLGAFAELPDKSQIKAYRTSATEDLKRIYDIRIENEHMIVNIPSQCIMTFVLPMAGNDIHDDALRNGCEYLIVPRHETERAITASNEGNITIERINGSEAQRWSLREEGNMFVLENALGQRITAHRSSKSTSLTAMSKETSEQTFSIEEVDFPYYKILSSKEPAFAFDLVNEKTEAGTAVGLWEYNTTSTPTHRQWMFVPIPQSDEDNTGIQSPESIAAPLPAENGVYTLSGKKVGCDLDSKLHKGIYLFIENGRSHKRIVR